MAWRWWCMPGYWVSLCACGHQQTAQTPLWMSCSSLSPPTVQETVRVTWLSTETRLIERVPERLPAPRHKTNLPRSNNDLISPPTKTNAPTSLREKKFENSKMQSAYLQTYPQFFPFISFCNIEALQYIIERKIIKTINQDCLPQSDLDLSQVRGGGEHLASGKSLQFAVKWRLLWGRRSAGGCGRRLRNTLEGRCAS